MFPSPSPAAHGVQLRRLTTDDVPLITAACSNPALARFMPLLPSPYTERDAEQFVAGAAASWEQGTAAPFAIAGDDGSLLGAVELHLSQDDPALAAVGYWLRPEAQGRGAATIAVRLVARWAFDVLRIRRLQLTTDPRNVSSQRVAERAGFTREGLLRAWLPTPTGRRDSVVYSLLPED